MNFKKFAFLATGLILSTTCNLSAEKSHSSSTDHTHEHCTSAYANVYTQQSQTIQPNSFFLFEGHTRTKHINTSKAHKNGKLVICCAGKYAIRYIVSPNDSEGPQMAITLNGKVVPATKISGNTPLSFVFGAFMSNEVILRLKKGDVLQLKNIGSTPITLSGAPERTLAELTIQKM